MPNALSAKSPCNLVSISHEFFPTLPHHNDATASTAPAALKTLLFVILTSTGYIHSIHFPQPTNRIRIISSCSCTIIGHKLLTPICKLPPKVFPSIWHNDHREQ